MHVGQEMVTQPVCRTCSAGVRFIYGMFIFVDHAMGIPDYQVGLNINQEKMHL